MEVFPAYWSIIFFPFFLVSSLHAQSCSRTEFVPQEVSIFLFFFSNERRPRALSIPINTVIYSVIPRVYFFFSSSHFGTRKKKLLER